MRSYDEILEALKSQLNPLIDMTSTTVVSQLLEGVARQLEEHEQKIEDLSQEMQYAAKMFNDLSDVNRQLTNVLGWIISELPEESRSHINGMIDAAVGEDQVEETGKPLVEVFEDEKEKKKNERKFKAPWRIG